MDPAEETKLPPKLIALEIGDEADKAEHIEHERDEAMMSCERNEVGIDKDDMLEFGRVSSSD